MSRAYHVLILGCLYASIACATAVSEKNRAQARVHYDLGVTSLERGDMRGALRSLRTSVENDPELPEAHNALGLVYHSMNKLPEALQHYEIALRLNPKFSEASNNLGILLIDLGRYDDAIAAFEAALSDILYATPTLAEGNMGWAYYKKGDVDRALEHIGNALASDPQFCRGYEWMMRIGLEQNRPADVVSNGKRFARHCADNPQVATSLRPEYVREMQYYWALGYLKEGSRHDAQALLSRCADVGKGSEPDPGTVAARCAASLRTLQ